MRFLIENDMKIKLTKYFEPQNSHIHFWHLFFLQIIDLTTRMLPELNPGYKLQFLYKNMLHYYLTTGEEEF